MSKITSLTALAAALALALPAAAGSWPNLPRAPKAKAATVTAQAPRTGGGFVEEAGDATSSLEQYRYFPSEEYRGKKGFAFDRAPAAPLAKAGTVDGFEATGGEPGWQLSQHKYVIAGGRFAHSEECDHAMRYAKGPTPQEVDAARRLSPGT